MTVEDDANGLLANSRINFRRIDQSIVYKYDAEILSKVNNFFIWLEEQKHVGKEIIRNETGRIRLPKTPRRGYCFSQEAETFQKCRKKLLDSVIRNYTADFASDGNTAPYLAHTPKSSRNTNARAIKGETTLTGRMNNDRKMPVPLLALSKQCASKQKTPFKVNKYPPVTSAENNTPKRTPLKNVLTPKFNTRKFLTSTEATARKVSTVDTPKIAADRKNTVTPKATIQQSLFKRSDVIRKMESRANTVIKNKQELMKEKAERARRDREERALRVKMNNKKKEEEALEKLRIIKIREQQIEELRQKQSMPQRAISKSPCRTRGYYNRTQKPLVHAKSSQNIVISAPNKVLQKPIAKGGQENVQFQGKRNHADNVEQNTDIQNKRQKLDLVESCAGNDNESCSTESDEQEKVLGDKLASGQPYTDCPESGDKRNPEEKGSSGGNASVADDPGETLAVIKQETSGTLRSYDVSPHIIMHPSMVENSETNKKGNVDEALRDIECNIPTVETNIINNQTFDKSLNISKNGTLDEIGNNYDVESISSNDETDDEENPRKPVPFWAQGEQLRNALRKQILQPPIDPDAYFGPVRTPMLDKIFARNRTRYNKRTSSAVWTSPMSNPKQGTSKFFELQDMNGGGKP